MLRASALTVGVSLALALVSLVNTSITARALGVEGRGLLSSALLVVALAQGVSLLGLGQAFVYHKRNDRLRGDGVRHLTAAVGLVVLLGALVSAVLVPFGPVSSVATVACVTIILGGVGTGFDFLVASSRLDPGLRLFNWLRALGPALATLSIVLVWAFANLNVLAVVSLQAVSTACAVTIGYLAIRRLLRTSSASSLMQGFSVPRFLRSGAGYQGVSMVALFLTHAHMYIVMLIGTLATFGLYSAAFGLSRMISPIQMSIGNAVFATSAGSDELERGAAAIRAFRVTFFPLLLLATLISVVAPSLIGLLLGGDFAAASRPFAVLVFEAVVAGAAFILGQHLQAAGRVRVVLTISGLSTIPIILGAVALGETNVLLGMACLMLFSSLLRLLVTLVVYRQKFGANVFWVIPTVSDCRLVLILARRAIRGA